MKTTTELLYEQELKRRLRMVMRCLVWTIEDLEDRRHSLARKNLTWAETWMTLVEDLLRG